MFKSGRCMHQRKRYLLLCLCSVLSAPGSNSLGIHRLHDACQRQSSVRRIYALC
jgi:hypothetical protein